MESITDELRKWGYGFCGDTHDVVNSIADRIDAEHESACAEAYGNGVMSVPIAVDESKWVKLPVDADGVPIRVGDVMDGNRGTVTCIRDAGHGWEIVTDHMYSYNPADLHHHAPTVEDVLTDLLEEHSDPTCDATPSELAEKYAAKLQLKEEA